ncbi:hypothetical protein ASPZODRAFT_773293 [Penicilliopsis zonata CBS 506.65]|uniref:Aldose 1-epimerase n=1 Tax=Penicilliopsis zonata CBS 506.65 TaxID=1073090 RepID=A0A1L9SB05_9EURO|nr:hypothetical protein ASPZODRAFT_773293 [Penicilliopsis zonata CBS 506.65]OJJ44331.1 hypothetical protein ASPZODRAFT_773293 [Penicilliopsis zonata CBS 506.65]
MVRTGIYRPRLPWFCNRLRSVFCPARVSPRVLLIYGVIFLSATALLGVKMHVKSYFAVALSGLPVLATATSASSNSNVTAEDAAHFKEYTISAGNINATFIPYGARLTSLLVPDRDGNVQDVVVGYDDPLQYLTDTETVHTYFGAVVGRYANRIKNGTFNVRGQTYHIPENEHDGEDTLHGGFIGYDQRNWTVTSYTDSHITFTLLDEAFQGFPGDVITHAIYSVDNEVTPENPKGLPQLTTKLVSLALTERTPIMLANHIYWNLNAFKESTILNDTYLEMPWSPRYVAVDGIEVPNGTILEVFDTYNGALDFTSSKLVGQDIFETEGLCGTGCTGYDTCWMVDRPPSYSAPDSMIPSLRMSSNTTGIALEVTTNQNALQIYTCNELDGTIPVRASQLERNEAEGDNATSTINQFGCLVIETEGWIDAINYPEWGQQTTQFYDPFGPPAINWATYRFDTIS